MFHRIGHLTGEQPTVFAVLGLMAGVGWSSWPVVFLSSLLATVALTLVRLRQQSYHGVGWKTVNPQLRQWWQARTTLNEITP